VTALEGHIRRLFPLEASFVMEDEIFNGTGAGQSQGILGATATVSVAKENNQAATTLKYENVIKMWARLWSGSEANAVWYANKDTFPQWMQMFLAAGTAAIPAQAVQFVSGKFTVFGRPVEFVEYCQTLGTTGDVYLADLTQYLGVRKGDLQEASSIHVAFTTDEMALRFTWRYTAEPLWRSALQPKNGSNNMSPFVKLDTRS
jgi:HK97 family phage major capsid protein